MEVACFQPPERDELSLDEALDFETRARELFPPIFAIDTMDLFALPGNEQLSNGEAKTAGQLFQYGRPLWGCRLRAGDDVYGLIDLANSKVDQGPMALRPLALLSYRLNFYVVNNAIAEYLVHSLMRHMVYVSPDRDLIRTTQPSEPILAHVASRAMSDHQRSRLEVLQTFVQSSYEGSINIGDLGGMVGAIILLFAFDRALEEEELPSTVSVACFMEALLGIQAAADLARCVGSDQEMREIWEEGHVFANHFVRLNSVPDESTLKGSNLPWECVVLTRKIFPEQIS